MLKNIYIIYGRFLAYSEYNDIEDIYDDFFNAIKNEFCILKSEDLFNKYYQYVNDFIEEYFENYIDDFDTQLIYIIDEMIVELENRVCLK